MGSLIDIRNSSNLIASTILMNFKQPTYRDISVEDRARSFLQSSRGRETILTKVSPSNQLDTFPAKRIQLHFDRKWHWVRVYAGIIESNTDLEDLINYISRPEWGQLGGYYVRARLIENHTLVSITWHNKLIRGSWIYGDLGICIGTGKKAQRSDLPSHWDHSYP